MFWRRSVAISTHGLAQRLICSQVDGGNTVNIISAIGHVLGTPVRLFDVEE